MLLAQQGFVQSGAHADWAFWVQHGLNVFVLTTFVPVWAHPNLAEPNAHAGVDLSPDTWLVVTIGPGV